VRTVVPPGRQAPRRARPKAALWIAACAACVLAIAAAAIYIAGRHSPPPAAAVSHGHAARKGAHLAAPRQAIPADFAGNWSGTVHQTNPGLTVTVQITLTAGTAHGTIGYPQLGCSGKLGLLSQRHDLLTLGLTITSGQNSCVNGKVRLTEQSNGRLGFTFLQPNGDDPTGTLGRVF
jgi:hypothetical protein